MATEYRSGGRGNFTFIIMHHTFLVVTVKKMVKIGVHYGSYHKFKTGVLLFWTSLYVSDVDLVTVDELFTLDLMLIVN